MSERIAKLIARSGVCSRRDAEKLMTISELMAKNYPLSNKLVCGYITNPSA